MLRTLVLVFAGALALAGAVLIANGVVGPGAYALGLGVLVLLGTAFERWRYRGSDSRASAGWEPTGERFEDPHTGTVMQVYYDPRSGQRHYVRDSQQRPKG